MLRDRRVDDPADLAVTRFGDLTDELLLGQYHYTRGPEARLEHLDVFVDASTSSWRAMRKAPDGVRETGHTSRDSAQAS